jgi:hypothetical protein
MRESGTLRINGSPPGSSLLKPSLADRALIQHSDYDSVQCGRVFEKPFAATTTTFQMPSIRLPAGALW